MKALKYFIASLLLTSGTTFAQTETVDHKIDITHQNSSLVKIRDIETNKDLLNPILHGRLTRSYLSRDIDPGFITEKLLNGNAGILNIYMMVITVDSPALKFHFLPL